MQKEILAHYSAEVGIVDTGQHGSPHDMDILALDVLHQSPRICC